MRVLGVLLVGSSLGVAACGTGTSGAPRAAATQATAATSGATTAATTPVTTVARTPAVPEAAPSGDRTSTPGKGKLKVRTITVPKPSRLPGTDLRPSAADRAAVSSCRAAVENDQGLEKRDRSRLRELCAVAKAADGPNATGTPRQRCERLIAAVTLGPRARQQAAVRKACGKLGG